MKDHSSSGFKVIEASAICILTKKNVGIVGHNGDLCLDDGDDLSDFGVNDEFLLVNYDIHHFATMKDADYLSLGSR